MSPELETGNWKLAILLSIRRRTGVLLLVIVVGQLFLISAQVPSKSGVPVFQAVTFGALPVCRVGPAGFLRGIGNIWGNYVWRARRSRRK
jgi:hypothetical protein